MGILANNILSAALRVIPKVRIEYRKFISRSVSDFGVVKMNYSEWNTTYGMVESGKVRAFTASNISEKNYSDFGLDWSERGISVWIPNVKLSNTVDDDGCDQVRFNGKIFNVNEVEDWDVYNSWVRVYCVEDKTVNP